MPADFDKDIRSVQRIDAVPAILDVVCRATGMGFAAVARVTDTHWIACAIKDNIGFGLKQGGELKLETTICNEIRHSGEPVIINHVAEDAAFCGHPAPAMYGFQSYISMPIFRADKSLWGTLCAIDPRPADLKRPEIVDMFRLFGELIASHLDAADRLAESQAALMGERQTADLREQFIAVLGHDLRNPLASIQSGLNLLERHQVGEESDDPRSTAIMAAMQSSVDRMTELIGNVLDFARGRLGGGLHLNRIDGALLGPTLEHVVDELRAANPGRRIETAIEIARPLGADPARIGQLLSNLVANALVHGDPRAPIRVGAMTSVEDFTLWVSNGGAPIPPDTMVALFQPFFRAAASRPSEGLGLGLYIASEIARAHGGSLSVSSTPQETRFTFKMPV